MLIEIIKLSIIVASYYPFQGNYVFVDIQD